MRTGREPVAGGNIWWDMAGNVHFSSSVSASWQVGIDAAAQLAHNVNTILLEHPLTYIGATGIYTGTLNAGQITTGFLSAERLEAGSIEAGSLGCRQYPGRSNQYGLHQRTLVYLYQRKYRRLGDRCR